MIRKNQNPKNKLSLGEHLNELRNRLLFIIISFIIFSLIGYLLREEIIAVVIAPLRQQLFFTSPAGGLEFALQSATLFGFFLTVPIISYSFSEFIRPVLGKKELFFLNIISFLSCILLISGILCAYFIFIPVTLNFLLAFNSGELQSFITTREYMKFVSFYLISFSLIFQFPLILLIINLIHEIPIAFLLQQQKLVIVLSFIISAFITPTMDIINQTIIAIPIVLLYEISILFLWIYKKNLWLNSKNNSVKNDAGI